MVQISRLRLGFRALLFAEQAPRIDVGGREQIVETPFAEATRHLAVAYIQGADPAKTERLEKRMLELAAGLRFDDESPDAQHLRTIAQIITEKGK